MVWTGVSPGTETSAGAARGGGAVSYTHLDVYKRQGYNIAEAAELVGYHDCSYFSRVFKKYCGVSPKQFILEGDKAPISMDGG